MSKTYITLKGRTVILPACVRTANGCSARLYIAYIYSEIGSILPEDIRSLLAKPNRRLNLLEDL